MGTIKVWTTTYPTTVDDRITSLPVLIDTADDVIASHPNALADAVIVLEQENVGYKDNSTVTAATDVYEDQRDVERVIGGINFNGANLANLLPHLRAVGIYNSNGGAVQGDLRVRMYDMGVPNTPLLPPVLRATVSINNSTDGDIATGQTVLTLSASPGVNGNQIHNSLRSYEFRVIQDGMDAGATSVINWAGIALGATQ